MGIWVNENDSILRMRITKRMYAEAFIQKGSIKFNTPDSWVKYAIDHGDGLGDFYEGTLAFCHFSDINHMTEFMSKYQSLSLMSPNYRDLMINPHGQRILFKDKRSMQLPCFCLYALNVGALGTPTKAGKQEFNVQIPGSYFKDFADNMTVEEVSRLPEKDQPAVIIIEDFSAFKSRLCAALEKLGVKESEILLGYINYKDFESFGPLGWFDFGQKYPNELFIKNIRFSNQREARIIINTTDSKILEALNKPLELGDMSGIAKIYTGYFPEGLNAKIELDVYSVD